MEARQEERMGKELGEFAEKAGKLAAESAEAWKEKLGSLKGLESVEELQALAGDCAEDAAAFIRKYPLASVLGALGAGVLLGSLLGRRR
jgi:ElaB/YqjD/DUF883 family membrane-anchored ribosome-binding protein